MATKPFSVTRLVGEVIVQWANLAQGDDGEPFDGPAGYSLESVQIEGTPDTADVQWEARNDTSAAFRSIQTAIGAADIPTIVKASFQGVEHRPNVDGGGPSTDLTITAFYRDR